MFNSTSELLQTLSYYLRHEAERERIVRNARALTLRRHLWSHRAATLASHVSRALGRRRRAAVRAGEPPPLERRKAATPAIAPVALGAAAPFECSLRRASFECRLRNASR